MAMMKDKEQTGVYVDDRLLDALLGAPSQTQSAPPEPEAAPAPAPPPPAEPVAAPAPAPPPPAEPAPSEGKAVTLPGVRPQVRVNLSPEEHFRQGLERLDRGDAAGAVRAFERCLSMKPDWTDALFNQALALWRSGNPNAATTVFERVLELDPESTDAAAALAVLALERQDEARARAYGQMLGGTAWEISYNLALLSQQQGALRQAEVLYRQVLAAKPECVEALVNLGHVLRDLGADREAADCWRRAANSNGDAARPHFPGE